MPVSKSQLIERVNHRARKCYELEVDGTWFDDFVKDGFFPWEARSKNEGQSPTYRYDHRFYRRALQLVRLRRLRIVDRDSLKVQLFIRGYSEPMSGEVKKALHKEYVQWHKKLLHQVRSGYPDNKKTVPEGHKVSLIQQLGPLDKRFNDAGLQLPPDLLIESLRKAKQDPLDSDAPPRDDRLAGKLIGLRFEDAAKVVMGGLSGLLMFDEGSNYDSSDVDDIEKLILHADDRAYLRARQLFWLIVRQGASAVFANIKADRNAEAHEAAAAAITFSAQDRPEWASLVLTLCLKLASPPPQAGEKSGKPR